MKTGSLAVLGSILCLSCSGGASVVEDERPPPASRPASSTDHADEADGGSADAPDAAMEPPAVTDAVLTATIPRPAGFDAQPVQLVVSVWAKPPTVSDLGMLIPTAVWRAIPMPELPFTVSVPLDKTVFGEVEGDLYPVVLLYAQSESKFAPVAGIDYGWLAPSATRFDGHDVALGELTLTQLPAAP
jgi:hypothetical protein